MEEKKKKTVKIRDIMYELVKLPEDFLEKRCKITIIDNNKTMIEGYKSIIDFSSTYIGIGSQNLEINIYGKNLGIQEVSNEDLLIEGEITEIYFKKVGG